MARRGGGSAWVNVFIFALLVYTGLLSQYRVIIMPGIIGQFEVSLLSAGISMIIGMAGYWAAFFLCGRLSGAIGLKAVMTGGIASVALGSVGMMTALSGYVVVPVSMFMIFLGVGFIETVAGELSPSPYNDRNIAARFLWIRGTFFGLGSVAGITVGGMLISRGLMWNLLFAVTVPAAIGLLIWTLVIPIRIMPRRSIWGNVIDSRIWQLSISAGFFEALSIGVGTWLVLLLKYGYNYGTDASILYLGGYLVAALLGRVIGVLFCERLGYVRLIVIGAVMASAFIAVPVALGWSFVYILLVSGMFASFAAPAVYAMSMKEFERGAGAAVRMVTGFSGIICVAINILVLICINLFGFQAAFFILATCALAGIPPLLIFKRDSVIFGKLNFEAWEQVRTKRAEKIKKRKRDFEKWEIVRTRPLEDDLRAIEQFTRKALSRKPGEAAEKPDEEMFNWARQKVDDANKKDLDELDAAWIEAVAIEKAEAKRAAKAEAKLEKEAKRQRDKNKKERKREAAEPELPEIPDIIEGKVIMARYPYMSNGKVRYETKVELMRLRKEPIDWEAAEREVIEANKRRMDELDAAIDRAIKATQNRIDVLEAALERAKQEALINGPHKKQKSNI